MLGSIFRSPIIWETFHTHTHTPKRNPTSPRLGGDDMFMSKRLWKKHLKSLAMSSVTKVKDTLTGQMGIS